MLVHDRWFTKKMKKPCPDPYWHVFLSYVFMKKPIAFAGLFLVLVLSAFVQTRTGRIHGRVVPYNAALNVWAVSNVDTERSVITNGEFEIKNLKAGRYRVIVEGRHPYKVTTRPDVIVSDSSTVNIGDIVLDQ